MQVPSKLLMGPGPSNSPPQVLQAMTHPLLGHLHPEFTQVGLRSQDGIAGKGESGRKQSGVSAFEKGPKCNERAKKNGNVRQPGRKQSGVVLEEG